MDSNDKKKFLADISQPLNATNQPGNIELKTRDNDFNNYSNRNKNNQK